MKKLILFSHHYIDDNIVNRYNNLKKLNSNWDVIPIGFDGYNLLPNSLIVNKKEYPTNKAISYFKDKENYKKFLNWADPDLFIYDGYKQLPNYDEYFLYEYDTICNVSIEDFFNTNVDMFGNGIRVPIDENWIWAKIYRENNPYNFKFNKMYSYGQSTCIYFRNHILNKIYNEIIKNKHLYYNMLSELRGGTLTSQFTTLKKGREDIENYISWIDVDLKLNLENPYFYHPIK